MEERAGEFEAGAGASGLPSDPRLGSGRGSCEGPQRPAQLPRPSRSAGAAPHRIRRASPEPARSSIPAPATGEKIYFGSKRWPGIRQEAASMRIKELPVLFKETL